MPRRMDIPRATERLKSFYRGKKRLPSFAELGALLRYRSKGAVSHLVDRLIERNVLRKDAKGRLIPTPALSGGVKCLGTVQAGFPSPAEEELIDTLSLDEFLIQRPESTFMIAVRGDSMIDAGIHPGDLILVERGREPKSGDIVIAQVDGEWTLKTYAKSGKRVILRAANKHYPDIVPREELLVGGVVRACIRRYGK